MRLDVNEPFGRYRIIAELGRGGMGAVFRARDTLLERDVALKVLAEQQSGNAQRPPTEGATRLLREARAAAAINHPNAVSLFDVGEVEGIPYLAMELISGRTLRTYVGQPAPAVETRLAWMRDVANALAAAHARKLVHRDVKPENVMVRDDGLVKVLDFGIARAQAGLSATGIDALTATGRIIGTPAYMPPEQVRAETLDGRTDQFAWGVVTYELLCGSLPWGSHEHVLRVIAEMATKAAPPIGPRVAGLSESAAAVVMRALCTDPDARFPSMEALIAELESALALRASVSRPSRTSAPDPAAPSIPTPTATLDSFGATELAGPARAAAAAPAAAAGVSTIITPLPLPAAVAAAAALAGPATSPSALQPGEELAHFVIVSELGAGGMGRVYLARDTKLEREVALKIVDPEAADVDSPTLGRARISREARAAAALDHPNIVTIYEVGEVARPGDAPLSFIAMERVKGASLRTYIADAAVPLERRIAWLSAVARALGAAHAASIIHRDVKPENVMIRSGDDVVKVLDFGLARRTAARIASAPSGDSPGLASGASAPRRGAAAGTPYYMAPEQMRRETLDGRADQFAWGVMAYELLSGVRPWGDDADELELVSKVLTAEPAPLDTVAPEIPAEVRAVVRRAMTKDREHRFLSMEDLVAALTSSAAVAASLPPRARPPRTTPAPPRRSRAVIIAAVLGAGAIALGVSRISGSKTNDVPASPSAASSAAAGASPQRCQSSAACVKSHGGQPFVCTSTGACAAVESQDCKARFEPGDLERDDTVWVGAMFPMSGPDAATFGQLEMNAIELGRRDFARAAGMHKAMPGHPRTRAIALVACDDAADGERAAKHLTEDLEVPAVIGFKTSDEAVNLASSSFVPRDVLTLTSSALSPRISAIANRADRPRLVFRTTYNIASTTKAVAAFISRLESELGERKVIGAGRPLKVAVVGPKGQSVIGEGLMTSLHFNGKSVIENDDLYREITFERDGERGQYPAMAAQLATFAPHVVVFAAEGELLEKVERAWPKSAAYRPIFVTNNAFDPELVDFMKASAERRSRLFGLTTVSSTPPNARFVLHYNEVFDPKITRTFAPNASYDAFYVVAYATYALGAEPVNGPSLARAIGRLVPPGTAVDVGITGMVAAFGALDHGESIDLSGAAGKLDFDLRTGEASVDFAILCGEVDDHGVVKGGVESGLVYDGATGVLGGQLRCR